MSIHKVLTRKKKLNSLNLNLNLLLPLQTRSIKVISTRIATVYVPKKKGNNLYSLSVYIAV